MHFSLMLYVFVVFFADVCYDLLLYSVSLRLPTALFVSQRTRTGELPVRVRSPGKTACSANGAIGLGMRRSFSLFLFSLSLSLALSVPKLCRPQESMFETVSCGIHPGLEVLRGSPQTREPCFKEPSALR